VHAYTVQRADIIAGITAGAIKQIGNAGAGDSFRLARNDLDVTQSGTLRWRQT
jgi:hypothetical protein